MKWQRRLSIWLVVALVTLAIAMPVLAAPPHRAGAPNRAASDGFWYLSMFGSPEKIWFPGQETIQSRGRWQGMRVISGDARLAGDWVFYFDEHFDRDWSGRWNGAFYAEVVTPQGRGSWEGRFHGECYGLFNGSGSIIHASGQGGGVLAGANLKIDLVEEGFASNYIVATIQ